MKSGMLAAETIVGAFEHEDFSSKTLRHYDEKVNLSWIYDELHPVRNFHGAFQKGRWSGLINTGLQFLTKGWRGALCQRSITFRATSGWRKLNG